MLGTGRFISGTCSCPRGPLCLLTVPVDVATRCVARTTLRVALGVFVSGGKHEFLIAEMGSRRCAIDRGPLAGWQSGFAANNAVLRAKALERFVGRRDEKLQISILFVKVVWDDGPL